MAQIGTIRLQTQNSGTVDVPVFETGDSSSDVYEFVRVETQSGTGFIPVTDTGNAAYPYLRVQSQNNGIVAVTDTAGSDIPDSGVARYTFDDADTDAGSALDTWNDNDATINGATTGVSGLGSYDSGEAYSFDGSGDNVQTPIADTFTTFSLSVWVSLDSSSGSEQSVMSTRAGGSGGGIRERGNNQWEFYAYDTDATTFQQINTGSLTTATPIHLIGVVDSDEIRLYEDGSLADSTPFGTYGNGNDIRIGGRADGGANLPGDIDDPRVYSKALSDTEASNLHSTGSIDG